MKVFHFIFILAVGILLPLLPSCNGEEENCKTNDTMEVLGEPNMYYYCLNLDNTTYKLTLNCPEGSAFIPSEKTCSCKSPNTVNKGICFCPLDRKINREKNPCKCPFSTDFDEESETCSCPKGLHLEGEKRKKCVCQNKESFLLSNKCFCRNKTHFLSEDSKECRPCPANTERGSSDPYTCKCKDEATEFDKMTGTCKCRGNMIPVKNADGTISCGCPAGAKMSMDDRNPYNCECDPVRSFYDAKSPLECVCKGNLAMNDKQECSCPGNKDGKEIYDISTGEPMCACTGVTSTPPATGYNPEEKTCCTDLNKVPNDMGVCKCRPITTTETDVVDCACHEMLGYVKDKDMVCRCKKGEKPDEAGKCVPIPIETKIFLGNYFNRKKNRFGHGSFYYSYNLG